MAEGLHEGLAGAWQNKNCLEELHNGMAASGRFHGMRATVGGQGHSGVLIGFPEWQHLMSARLRS